MIQSKDVHQGLPAQEMRDWLAREYYRTLDEGACPGGKDDYYVKEIAKLEKALKATREMRAIATVLEMHGFKWHDVSDEVVDFADGTNPEYVGFVGTDKERKARFK